jgi:hypothetical protein
MSEAADGGRLVPPPLQNGAPTEKLVYVALREHGPLTYRELIAHTGQGKTAVREAVRSLRPTVIESRRAARPDGRPEEKEHYIRSESGHVSRVEVDRE